MNEVYQHKKANGESTTKQPTEQEMIAMVERVKQKNASKS